jgi:UDP:flavonoid glycosyltransferase YjiC (YdhE family)
MSCHPLASRRDHNVSSAVRFLFSIRPFVGHFNPLVPTARALADADHCVIFATAERFCAHIRSVRFEAVPAGHDPLEPLPARRHIGDPRVDYGTWVTRRKLAALLEVATTWQPDVIVREPTDFAPILAAELLEIPHATIGFAQFYPVHLWQQQLGPTLENLRREFHLPPDPGLARLYLYVYLSTVPPWFEASPGALAPTVVPIRPGTFDEAPAAPGPPWLGALPSRPMVYASLGTVYNKNEHFFRTMVEALAGEDVEVVCTVGQDQDPDDVVPDAPSNIHIWPYIPQSQLYPDCAVAVSHGGFSTILGALCAGVPVVAVPHGADQFGNARRAAELGAGLVIDLAELTAQAMRSAVLTVLADDRFAKNARRLRASLHTLPGPAHAARLLADLPDLAAADVDVRSYSTTILQGAGAR